MSVVYLIGGCSRSGKSTLALRLLQQNCVPLLSTDVLDASFCDLGWIPTNLHDNGHQANKAVQQLLEPMIARNVAGHAPYVFEGIHLSPKFISKMVDQHKRSVRACVLGFPHVTVTDKMRRIRAVISEKPDWLVSRPSAFQNDYLQQQRKTSQEMRSQCLSWDVPFFDTGADFKRGLELAFSHLQNSTGVKYF